MNMPSDWRPFDDRHAAAQLRGVRTLIGNPPQRILELGCGDGRILVPLIERGHEMIGVDSDPTALAAAQNNGASPERLHLLDFTDPAAARIIEANTFNAVLCLGNTLMTIIDRAALARVFEFAVRPTQSHGRFIIDDFPFEYWREIAEGNWQEGISPDGSMQLIWQPGDPIFALRTGESIDPDNWTIGPDDRLHRLWSWSDLREMALAAGFSTALHQPENHLIVFSKGR